MEEIYLMPIFGIVIVIMLMLDLGVFHKKLHTVGTKEATIWTLIWIALSCIFGVFIYYQFGSEKAIEYFSAYLVEKSLSLDNIFVFILIFSFYKIPDQDKHKILFWGIMGAVILRAIFIFAGVWLIQLTYLPEMLIFGKPVEINVLLIVFAIILIYGGIKAFKTDDNEEKDYDSNFVIKFAKKIFPFTDDMSSGNFFVKKTIGEKIVRHITPIFLAMVTIELSDVIFAMDSIPAIFGISQDPIILYTSNIFAILGLRSLYFLLASIIKYFSRLKQGIALILLFIGVKMLIADFYHISAIISLIFILAVIILSILWSIIEKKIKKSPSAD